MRASILVWSSVSGIIVGLFVDASALGVGLVLDAVFPALTARFHDRWFTIAATAVLILVPLALGVLGYWEGELKTA